MAAFARRPSQVVDFGAAAAAPYSPLDRLGLVMRAEPAPAPPTAHVKAPASPSSPATPLTPPIPALDLNLFRSPSIYSVESGDSISIASSDDHYSSPYEFTDEPESDDAISLADALVAKEDDSEVRSPGPRSESVGSSPSTPRARRTASSDASASPCSGASTPTEDTPTDGTAQTLPYAPGTLRSAVSEAPFALRAVPVRTARSFSASSPGNIPPSPSALRSSSEPGPFPLPLASVQSGDARYPETNTAPDTASVYGEQGSDWGEDEAGFEWLDTDEAPGQDSLTEVNGAPQRLALGSRRLTRLRSAIVNGSSGLSGGKTSPLSAKSELPNVLSDSSTGSRNEENALERKKSKKKRPYVIPRRAAPPPPPGAGYMPSIMDGSEARRGSAPDRFHTSALEKAGSIRANGSEDAPLPPVVIINATPTKNGPGTPMQSPSLLAGKDDPMRFMQRSASDHSAYSSASSYSVYDFDDSPTRGTPITVPRGKYARLPINTTPVPSRIRIVAGAKLPRRPSAGDAEAPTRTPESLAGLTRTPSLATPMSPDELVHAGMESRKNGDLPKAAYLFMQAAERGSTTGRIHYGVALKYGAGMVRDERRAFNELLKACDRSLQDGDIDLRAASGSILSPQQTRFMTKDLAIGLFEIAHCFLEGVGTKRQPDLALEYLRMAGSLGDLSAQEQLGYILSKGVAGVKKDMKEAAKWYRVAIGNGSSTPGLAWVWKDKYSDA